MSTADLLSKLNRLGIRIEINGERLKLNGPKEALTDSLIEELKNNKEEIIKLLSCENYGDFEGKFPLSFLQQRLWFLEQLQPDSSAYNVAIPLRLKGKLNEQVLEQSLNKILERQKIFRTVFCEIDGEPVQVIKRGLTVKLKKMDISDIPEASREHKAFELVNEEISHPFRLAEGPLIRGLLVRVNENECIFTAVTHHFVADGWSLKLFMEELAILYSSLSKGVIPPLPELSMQYTDYSVWERNAMDSGLFEKQLKYWKNQLAGELPILEMPTDHTRPLNQSHNGSRAYIVIPEGLTQSLRKISHREGTTLFMVLLAVFQILLYHYSGQDDIIVATAISNRGKLETERIIGPFSNNLLLRCKLEGEGSFGEFLKHVRDTVIGAFDNKDIPFERIVEELKPDRDMSRQTLFQVMFTLQNSMKGSMGIEGLTLEPLDIDSKTSKFDLTLELDEGEELTGWFEYSTDLFEESTVERMTEHFIKLLEGIVQNPKEKISKISLMGEDEKALVLEDWNRTERDYPNECIHTMFEKQAKAAPDACAIMYRGEHYTYGQLDSLSSRIANYLVKQGLHTGEPVGVSIERSPEAVACILGILKAGGAYVPLDPSYPKERIAFMLEDSGLKLVLTKKDILKGVETNAVMLCIDECMQQISEESDDSPENKADSGSVAYIIYTSGSTGKPKGVQGLHKGIINRCNWMWRTYPYKEEEICCQKTALSFVDSICEIFSPLLKGIRLVIIPDETLLDVQHFVDELSVSRISRIVLVPSLLQAMLDTVPDIGKKLSELKLWVTSGETLRIELMKRFKQSIPNGRLINIYGSSEVSADVTYYDTALASETLSRVPIGRPIDNTEIYILDSNKQPVPIGVAGELYVAGDGLAKGYLNRPELTEERFVPNPYDTSGLMYRMGDMARYLPDGNIEYLGRGDNQVKIRGIRVELGEIESVLLKFPSVKEAVVVSYGEAKGDVRLAAYIVPNVTVPEVDELRSFIRGYLSEYMIPASINFVEHMPLLPNGKIDKKSLPNPELLKGQLEFTPPCSEIEKEIAQMWNEVLGVKESGINNSFFDMGGHSLMATQLISRIRLKFGVDLQLKSFFSSPTIKSIAKSVEDQILMDASSDQINDVLNLLEELSEEDILNMLDY